MAIDVIMPALGVTQETGKLIRWLKAEGQPVSKGEPLMEIETDKAIVEVEAPGSGVLAQVIARPGDEVPVGRRIALIVAPDEKVEPLTAASRESMSSQDRGRAPQAAPNAGPRPQTGRWPASPAARRIARERGIDLAGIAGSGPGGAVIARDVLQVPPGSPTAKRVVPLSAMRRVIGQRMVLSKQNAPHFYLSVDIDMTRIQEERKAWRPGTLVPSVNDFVLHACARALRNFPMLNASFTDHGIELHPAIHLGMAVALEEGLVVPVIRDADQLSLVELAACADELVRKAHSKKLVPADYDGGTFTVSNLGVFGIDRFVAIINPPQCAILALGRAAPRVVTDGDGVMIRTVMSATLSADHRVVDGALAAGFLRQLKLSLEERRE